MKTPEDAASPVAVVTGATGYVGSHLARALARGGWRVYAVVRAASAARARGSLGGDVRVLAHDGSTAQLVSLLAPEARRAAVVFHLASYFAAEHNPEDVVALVDSNVRFGAQVLEAMGRNGLRKFVSAGTGWQNYEGRAGSPVCLYAATKSAFDAVLRYYVEALAFQAITLTLFDVYGPADPRPKLFTLLRRAVEAADPLPMSPGEQLLDLVYVDDAVAAFVAAGARLLQASAGDALQETYTVSSGRHARLREVVATYAAVTGDTPRIRWGGRREVMVPWAGGMELPGWQARVPLEEGIRRMHHDMAGKP